MQSDQKIEGHVQFHLIDWTQVSHDDMITLVNVQRAVDDSLLSEIQLTASGFARLTSLMITCVVMLAAFMFNASPKTVFILAFMTQVLLYIIDLIGTYGMRLLKKQDVEKLNGELERLVKKYPR
jgi:hypothetical protein